MLHFFIRNGISFHEKSKKQGIKKLNVAYNIYGHERGVIIKKILKLWIVALVMFTIFFTSTKVNVHASGWGFKRNGEHQVPEIGRYQSIIEGTNSYYVGSKDSVYLTFDAGYDNGMMEEILNTLKLKNVKATFFLTGDFVKRFPELTKRIVNEGHIACNHSYTHRKITTLSKEELANDLGKLEKSFYELTKQEMPKYFRPPEGNFDKASLTNLKNLAYTTVFWSIAYVDWKTNKQSGADYCVKTIMDNLHDGAIILMHSVSSSNKEALPRLIDEIKNKGYTFKTVLDL